MRRLAAIAVALSLLGATGCFSHSVRDERRELGPRVTNEWKPYVIIGAAALGKETIVAECPAGIAYYGSRQSFLNGLVSVLTFQLFTPISLTYACAVGERPPRERPADGAEAPRETAPGQPPPAPSTPEPAEEPYDIPIL